jgi:formylglycine-generating enzyme required for sulfatase activity
MEALLVPGVRRSPDEQLSEPRGGLPARTLQNQDSDALTPAILLNPRAAHANPVRRIADYRRRWILSIGIRDYGDKAHTGLDSLPSAANDACRVFDVLTNNLGFEGSLLTRPEDVTQYSESVGADRARNLMPCLAGCGTEADIRNSLQRIASHSSEEDLFLLMFAGHGLRDGRGYLLPFGAVGGRHSTYLMYDTLWGALGNLRCPHRLLLLDCCYAGTVFQDYRDITARHEQKDQDPILLAERVAVIAATDSHSQALDRVRSSGINSPFTHALASGLEGLGTGAVLEPEDLYLSIRKGLEMARLEVPEAPLPVFFARGDGRIRLRSPGISWSHPRHVIVTAGQRLRVELKPVGAKCPFRLAIIHDGNSVAFTLRNGVLEGMPEATAQGTHEVRIELTDSLGQVSICTIRVQVVRRDTLPLALTLPSPEPCVTGRAFRYQPLVAGGTPPYRWEGTELPGGLVLLPETGELAGVIGDPRAIGSKSAHWPFQLTVRDSNDQVASASTQLTVVDSDRYCEVAGGAFTPGYSVTAERETELQRLGIRENVHRWCEGRLNLKSVHVPRYFIKRFPVTNQEWREFVAATGHPTVPTVWSREEFDALEQAELPITDIPRTSMEAYCRWRGTNLPTARQWEKAAMGTDGRLFPWGDTFRPENGNHQGSEWGEPTRVDQYLWGASPSGALDMAGNVSEVVREHRLASQSWTQAFRGGDFLATPVELVNAVATPGGGDFRMQIPAHGSHLEPVGQPRSRQIGFRDVIEIASQPLLRQELLELAASQFQLSAPDRRPLIVVTPRAFIARYTVSNEEYLEFCSSTLHQRPPHWKAAPEAPFAWHERHLPVVQVSYEDARKFCAWKSGQLGRPCHVLELKYWRAAVHGPGKGKSFTGRRFPWGQDFVASYCNDAVTGLGSAAGVHEIPEGRAACGAYHLVGNVYEWVAPDLAIGGSWMTHTCDPDSWERRVNSPQPDVGFRYFSIRA